MGEVVVCAGVDGGAVLDCTFDSGNGVCVASMLGQVCDGIVKGREEYGGGTVIAKESIGITADG